MPAGAYRIFSCDGSNTDDVILAAADRAVEDGMDIINMCAGLADLKHVACVATTLHSYWFSAYFGLAVCILCGSGVSSLPPSIDVH